ncbi:MAG: hypothetical protein M3Y64_04820, partial [Gemmatimonadota bacterium]|nr:hypothetical protein [Gemmatimonadota bacterium]
RYSDQHTQRASVSTWLVAVVRNITIDWLRHRDGRRRVSVPDTLTTLQQQIYVALCTRGQSHVEAFETIRSHDNITLSFGEFLREVRATQRIAPCSGAARPSQTDREPVSTDAVSSPHDPAAHAEMVRRLTDVLATQPADVRLAVQLFVVERMAAADVATAVGWSSTKTVYNRVYRALAAMRVELQRTGIGPHDL